DRSQFYKDFALMFYGANRPGATVSQGTLDQFWLQCMQAGLKNAYDCIKAFSETDFTEDLKKLDVATLILHGEDDQIVPINDSASSPGCPRRRRIADSWGTLRVALQTIRKRVPNLKRNTSIAYENALR